MNEKELHKSSTSQSMIHIIINLHCQISALKDHHHFYGNKCFNSLILTNPMTVPDAKQTCWSLTKKNLTKFGLTNFYH